MIRVLLAAMLFAAGARAGDAEAGAERPRALTAVPSNGVDEAPRRGTFAEASLGVFATTGGTRFLSNAQPYLGLTVGRDLGAASSLFLSIGVGASSDSCFQTAPGGCVAADSFGATFLELGASTGVWASPRVLLSAKLMGGATIFSPGPFTQKDGATVPERVVAPHLGVGLAFDYDTRLDHFAVGLDAAVRYSLPRRVDGGSGGIGSVALMPRIRYVF